MLSDCALKPPIFRISTFVLESAAADERHLEDITGKQPGGDKVLACSRFNGPDEEILNDRPRHLGTGPGCAAFWRGTSVIATRRCWRWFGQALKASR
jgi:hypothetical protein